MDKEQFGKGFLPYRFRPVFWGWSLYISIKIFQNV